MRSVVWYALDGLPPRPLAIGRQDFVAAGKPIASADQSSGDLVLP